MLSRKQLIGASLLLAAIPGVSTLMTPSAPATPPRHASVYEVSITNLTRGQIFSPAVVATHSAALDPLWIGGQPASSELANVAEDAVTQPLIDKLRNSGQVRDVQLLTGANGPILPGETATIRVNGDWWWHNRLSVAGMLVITNDAFYGLNGVALPVRGTASYSSPAYDAGSEGNNEKCDFIPGPPCGNPGVRDTANAEGFVHIHAGIHGIADLEPSVYDWRNGVASIRVRRVRR